MAQNLIFGWFWLVLVLEAVEGGAEVEDEVFTSTVPTPSTNTTYVVGNHILS